MRSSNKTLSVRLESSDLSKLRSTADSYGLTMSDLIRHAIRFYLDPAPLVSVEMSAGVQDGSLTVHADIPMFTGGIGAKAEVTMFEAVR